MGRQGPISMKAWDSSKALKLILILSLPPYGNVKTFSVTTPDGSIIEFIEMI